MLTSSSFTVGQMLQMIMPTIIALFLFIPFFETPSRRVDATTLVLSGIVLSYVIAGPVSLGTQCLINYVPMLRTRLKECKEHRNFLMSNWRINDLEAHLSKDDREAVHLVGHHMIFDRILCFYLMAYFLFNVVFLISKLTSGDFPLNGTVASCLLWLWNKLSHVKTPIFGGGEVPTVVVTIVSLLPIITLLDDYLKKYKQQFLPGGDYDTLAKKYQREKGNIAASVWGRVRAVEKDGKKLDCPVSGLGVWLVNTDGSEVGPSKTDAEGYFQFKDAFAMCRQGCRTLKFDETYTTREGVYSVEVLSPTSLTVTLVDEKAVPFFPITVALVKKPTCG